MEVTDQSTRAPRKNIFLAATVECGAVKAPVRIRNMSETGAMIEGAALPSAGELVRLSRMEIEIGAKVVWSQTGRCGIRFEGVAEVDEWIAGKTMVNVAGLSGQARVDAVQAALRAGRPIKGLAEPSPRPAAAIARTPIQELYVRIGEELAATQRLVRSAAEELGGDAFVLGRHPSQLQSLQAAADVLAQLARVAGAEAPLSAVHDLDLLELRTRLLRRTLF